MLVVVSACGIRVVFNFMWVHNMDIGINISIFKQHMHM